MNKENQESLKSNSGSVVKRNATVKINDLPLEKNVGHKEGDEKGEMEMGMGDSWGVLLIPST